MRSKPMGPKFYIIVIGIKYNYYAKIPNFYNGSPQGFKGSLNLAYMFATMGNSKIIIFTSLAMHVHVILNFFISYLQQYDKLYNKKKWQNDY